MATPCSTCGVSFTPDASPAGLCPACLLTGALAFDDSGAADDPDSSTLQAGTTLGPFEIVGVLGKGGMSSVYEAYEAPLGRVVALKVLPPEFLHDESFAQRFQREARVVAMLEHPHIVPIYASGIDAGIPWMSMRLLDGGTLGALIATGRLDARRTAEVLRGVGEALDYAHARGVIHRDIKPSNILLDRSGHVCVGDFGVAHLMERSLSLTRTGTITGTPHYMAPEQALGKAIDHRSDSYSLGVVAYEMLTGVTPFAADSPVAVLMMQVNDPLPVPSRDVVPEPVFRVLQKALAKDPRERWSTASALVAALEASVDARSSRAWPIAAGATALAAAAIALALLRPFVDSTSLALPAVPAPAVARAPQLPPVTVPAPSTSLQQPRPVRDPAADGRKVTSTPAAASQTLPSEPPPNIAPPASAKVSMAANVSPGSDSTPPPPVERAVAEPAPAPAAPRREDVVTQPQLIRSVKAAYPPAVRAARITGDVLVEAVVGPEGNVLRVVVIRSVHPLLDEAARRAVLQFKYKPGVRNGVPGTFTIQTTVSFRLE